MTRLKTAAKETRDTSGFLKRVAVFHKFVDGVRVQRKSCIQIFSSTITLGLSKMLVNLSLSFLWLITHLEWNA